jgi:hypothetical protein
MIICASDTGFEVLKRAKTISVDGTFATCPPPFLQVKNFSNHSIYQHVVFVVKMT